MDFNRRNSLLFRIMQGEFPCIINDIEYTVKQPSLEIQYAAQGIYEEALYTNRFQHWLNANLCKTWLLRAGIITPNLEKEIKQEEKFIEDLKVGLFKSVFSERDNKRIRQQLKIVKERLFDMYERQSLLDSVTIDGFANTLKYTHIVINTVYRDGKLFLSGDSSFALIDKLMQEITKKQISISDYRELARSEPWRSRWAITKPLPFINITDEQKHLVLFSRMYDNAYENPKCPEDEVMDDDDMFDGWIINERRENERDRLENRVESKLDGRHSNAQEVFVMAHSKKDVEDINSYNDLQGKMVKKQRDGFIQQRGNVSGSDLPDQKLKIQRQSQKQFVDTVKGNQG